MKVIGDAVYLLCADEPAVRIHDDDVARLPAGVRSVETIDGGIWLATENGAYRMMAGEAVLASPDDLDVSDIVKAGRSIWLIASRNKQPESAWRLRNGQAVRMGTVNTPARKVIASRWQGLAPYRLGFSTRCSPDAQRLTSQASRDHSGNFVR
jgi:hypothetical protein